MLKGVAKMVHTYGEALRDDQFIERMSKIPLREIIRAAKERNVGSLGYAEAIFTFYNKKMKYPLQRHRLYDADSIPEIALTEAEQEKADGITAEENLFSLPIQT